MYQYTLKWDEVTQEIKRGDRFLCINDVVMLGDDSIAYKQGHTYVSDKDGHITNEWGQKDHEWRNDQYEDNWWDYFKKIPHPVEKCNCDKCEEVKAHYCHVEGTPKVNATVTTSSSNTIDRDYFQSVQDEFTQDLMNPLQEKSNEAFFGKRTFETGAVRDSNKGKPFIHTLLGYTRQRFGYHMAKNADKYGPMNFLKGIPTEAALESLDRHLAAYMAGDRSEDHLSAIIFGVQCCMLNEQKDGVEANEYFA